MQLGCLLHDASEAYISDLTRPVKQDQFVMMKDAEDEFVMLVEELQKSTRLIEKLDLNCHNNNFSVSKL